jgi:hypothetical protein
VVKDEKKNSSLSTWLLCVLRRHCGGTSWIICLVASFFIGNLACLIACCPADTRMVPAPSTKCVIARALMNVALLRSRNGCLSSSD